MYNFLPFNLVYKISNEKLFIFRLLTCFCLKKQLINYLIYMLICFQSISFTKLQATI